MSKSQRIAIPEHMQAIRPGRDEPANCIRFREIDKSTLTERMGCGGIRQTTFEDALLEDVGDTLA